jgi:hypothetical protein
MSGEVALEIFKRLDQKESRGITKCQTFQKWEISSTVTRYFSWPICSILKCSLGPQVYRKYSIARRFSYMSWVNGRKLKRFFSFFSLFLFSYYPLDLSKKRKTESIVTFSSLLFLYNSMIFRFYRPPLLLQTAMGSGRKLFTAAAAWRVT